MKILYRLVDDAAKIARIQTATLSLDEFGFQQTHGLFGSPEWWSKIESGELSVETLRGVISKVYMGSMGDWPEFRVKLADGSEQSFTRECASSELDGEYREGRTVEIDFVHQRFKKSWSGSDMAKEIIEIRVS